MAHGTPDWCVTASKKTIYSLHDMGELAVPLGAIHVHYRRGDIVFADRFDGGYGKVSHIGAGVGNEIRLSCETPLAGGKHLLFHTGPTAGDHAGFVKVVPYLAVGGIGVECSFIPIDDLSLLQITIVVYDGAKKRMHRIEYVHAAGIVQILDSGGGWPVIGTPGTLRTGYTLYSTIKAVVDTDKRKYVRVILNDKTYLASGYGPQVTDELVIRPSVSAQVFVVTAINAAIDVPIDRFIITQNEPT